MTHVRHRLSLLALGILAPVLAFGAIALSGAPPAEAIGEDPYLQDCKISEYSTACGSLTYCTTIIDYSCSQGEYTTTYTYQYDDINSGIVPGCYIGLSGFNYCP